MRWSRQHKFLDNYPFAELQLLGWQLTELGSPKRRPGAVDFIRTALFTDDGGQRAITFDIDRDGRMRDHATYAVGETVWVAETAQAAVRLGASGPDADRESLARIDGVTEFPRRR